MKDIKYIQCRDIKYITQKGAPVAQLNNKGWIVVIEQGSDHYVYVGWHKTREAAREHIKLLKKAFHYGK